MFYRSVGDVTGVATLCAPLSLGVVTSLRAAIVGGGADGPSDATGGAGRRPGRGAPGSGRLAAVVPRDAAGEGGRHVDALVAERVQVGERAERVVGDQSQLRAVPAIRRLL